MKNETVPVRLEDYRPPDFAIDTVELDFRLDPKATRVAARMALRPAEGARVLTLVGDEYTLYDTDQKIRPDSARSERNSRGDAR